MRLRLLLLSACIAGLCSCGSGSGSPDGRRTSRANVSANASGNSAAADEEQLQREIARAAELIQPALPIRQGEVTVDRIEARGTELRYHMRIPVNVDAPGFERFDQAFRREACADFRTRELFTRGGAYTYVMTDSGGEEFTTTIRECEPEQQAP